MKRLVKYTFAIVMCISTTLVFSQKAASLTVTVTPSQVRLGEPFMITYTASAEGKSGAVEIDGIAYSTTDGMYQIMDGGTSTNINIMNGKYSNSKTQTIYVVSHRAGHIELNTASVKIGGKKIQSNPVTIDVSPEKISTDDSVAAMRKLYTHAGSAFDFGDDIFSQFKQQIKTTKPHQPDGVSCRYDTAEYHVKANKPLTITYHIYAVNAENMSREKMEDGLVKDFSYPAGITMVVKPKEYVTSWSDTGYKEYEKVVSMTISAASVGRYAIAPFHYTLGEGEYTSPEVSIIAE